mmetsp:Transcript_58614/g.134478  ORF Transcript_58614/g.134478 Transcript_58614/m.134478 type:complete len:253 (+) Transcript_58614:490-1248(+)
MSHGTDDASPKSWRMAARLLVFAMSSALLPNAVTTFGSAPASMRALAHATLFERAARHSGVSPFRPSTSTLRCGAARTRTLTICSSLCSTAWCSTVLAMPISLQPRAGSAPASSSSSVISCRPAPTAWWMGVRPFASRALTSAPYSISNRTISTASARAVSEGCFSSEPPSSSSSSLGQSRSRARWRGDMCSTSSSSSRPSAVFLPQFPSNSSPLRWDLACRRSSTISASTLLSRAPISLPSPQVAARCTGE